MCRSGSSGLFAAIQISRIKAPHVGQIGRSTVRSGKEIVLKGATETSFVRVCRSHADQGCRQQRRRQRPGVRLQRPAQGKTREALIVPWAQTGPRIASAFVWSAQRRCAGLLRLGRLVFCRRGIKLSNHTSKILHRYSVLSHYVF